MISKSLKWSTLAYSLLFLLGISLIGWGVAISTASYSLVLTCLGGAVIGTSISCLVGNLKYLDFFSEVRESLGEMVTPGIMSYEHDISEYRTPFHSYHVTEINSQFVWRYAIFDFSKSYSKGRLTSKVAAPDKQGKKQEYLLQAGLVDERFIIFDKAVVGKEPAIIGVYPFFGKEFHGQHCGLRFVESWDGTNLVSPCIISRVPVEGWTKTGTVDPEVAKKLDKLWSTRFLQINKVLPRVSHEALSPGGHSSS